VGRRALPLVAFAAGGVVFSLSGFNRRDEAWFLQVVSRVANGDDLYGDVFFGATPLSVYLALPLVALLGAQIVWVKAVVVACFVATLVLVARIARRLGGGEVAAVLLYAAVLAWSPPLHYGPYQQLATVGLLACLAAALRWTEEEGTSHVPLALGGVGAGLAFAAKQNVGLLALAALLAAVALVPARRLSGAWSALAAFVASVVAVHVPVALTGSLDELYDYGFANKGAYVERGLAPVEGVHAHLSFVRDAWLDRGPQGPGLVDVATAYDLLAFAVVPASLVALLLAWRRAPGPRRRLLAVVGLFWLAALAAVFPRADAPHVEFVMPVFALAVAAGLLALRPGWQRRAAIALALALAPAAFARVGWPLVEAARGDLEPSGIAHFEGPLVHPADEDEIEGAAAELRSEGGGGDLFLLTPEAGFWYLASGLANPTPYDYPLVTAMGRDGEQDVVARIERGEIDAVCVDLADVGPLEPTALLQHVEREMRPTADTGACRVYRASGGVGPR
jgi:4-amino-4-deoxy-L-arabinose transferase-like glycosyltransferase